MDYFIFNFQKFMLVFVRIVGLVLTAPFFGSHAISVRVKLGLTFFLTAIIFPVAFPFITRVPTDLIEYSLLALMEGLIGVVLGFCLMISFAAFQLAGQFFTIQMGFGASEVFDPLSQISLPLMGQYLYLVGVLVFLALNGPLIIIREIFYSFELVSAENFLKYSIMESQYGVVGFFIDMFKIALRMAFPIMGTLLLVSFTMGLLAKAAPQMNLLMIGFPISISVGFIIMILLLPGLVFFFREFLDEVFKKIWLLMLEINRA